ncbi:MAG TPA: hypothetical protein VJ783_20855, partial [Pirellulales bacterium]|nr:hypothetical protein [Pirellulales bacterium]
SPYLERAFFSNRKKREVFGTWFKWLGWKLINVVVSLGSVVLGSAESGNSNLLPGMYRPKSGHRIGFMGDWTDECCHGPSKLRKALLAGA